MKLLSYIWDQRRKIVSSINEIFSLYLHQLTVNLALRKPTWEKHPWPDLERDFGSENAVDGMYKNRSEAGGQCTISDDRKYTAEWRVDLGSVVNIKHINIYYRTDHMECMLILTKNDVFFKSVKYVELNDQYTMDWCV